MVAVTLLVSDPAATLVDTGSADWVVSGTRPARLAGSLDDGTAFDTAVERATSLPGEYTFARIGADRGAPIRAYRGVASSYNLYYCRRPSDGAVFVGDHFRDLLSKLPLADRTVPATVPIDQLLFGTRPTGTYLEEVDRLGHGEVLTWSPDDGPETELVETLSSDGPIDVAEAKRRLDYYFRDALDADRFDGPVATMLSGGVDSTLLHTYLDADAAVSGAVTSPEFGFEVDYAREAVDLVGADHDFVTVDEDDFLSRVEATVDATGHPLMLPQSTLMHAVAAESPYRTLVNGGLADGLFGTGTAALAYLAQYLGGLSRYVPNLTWEIEQLERTTERLERRAFDPDGAAMNFRIHSDQDRVAALFGRDAVDERKRDRLRYTRRRVDAAGGTGYDSHMHLGHALEYFHDNILTIWRHAAHATGTAMQSPFGGREVFETALAVPPSDRYARFALPPRSDPTRVVQYKYLLKDLLGEKLPAYDTKKPKGHSQLPTGRYFESGPLSDAFDRYDLPEFVPAGHRDAVRNGTEEVTWYALNYAVWRDRILGNDDLDVFPSTRVIERQVARDGTLGARRYRRSNGASVTSPDEQSPGSQRRDSPQE